MCSGVQGSRVERLRFKVKAKNLGKEYGTSGFSSGFIVVTWVVVKIMIPFWIPIITLHLIFRVPKKGPYF